MCLFDLICLGFEFELVWRRDLDGFLNLECVVVVWRVGGGGGEMGGVMVRASCDFWRRRCPMSDYCAGELGVL